MADMQEEWLQQEGMAPAGGGKFPGIFPSIGLGSNVAG